jgi:uncharacterized membrane protein YtjA (UPF0391 family)
MAPFYAAMLAQDDFGGADAAGGAAALLFNCFVLLLVVFVIAGMWKVFTKAGKPGWAAIIPIYNTIVILEIVGRPIWWIILMLIPCVGFVIAIIVCIDLAKSFGKDALYGIGLAFLGIIFFPMLGFGSATYRGPAAAQT